VNLARRSRDERRTTSWMLRVVTFTRSSEMLPFIRRRDHFGNAGQIILSAVEGRSSGDSLACFAI
jgi:hypothetical protein